jgi:hypothetical protein
MNWHFEYLGLGLGVHFVVNVLQLATASARIPINSQLSSLSRPYQIRHIIPWVGLLNKIHCCEG